MFIPYQIINNDFERSFFDFKLYSVIIAIFLTSFGISKSKLTLYGIIEIISITIGASLFYYIVLVVTMFASMCAYTNRTELYQNKDNQNTKIIIREYGCGAGDSDFPSIHVHKVHTFNNKIEYYTDIDTNQINKNEWIKVDDMENTK